jgi:hypothetical protein
MIRAVQLPSRCGTARDLAVLQKGHSERRRMGLDPFVDPRKNSLRMIRIGAKIRRWGEGFVGQLAQPAANQLLPRLSLDL